MYWYVSIYSEECFWPQYMYPKLCPFNGCRWYPLDKLSHMGLKQLIDCIILFYTQKPVFFYLCCIGDILPPIFWQRSCPILEIKLLWHQNKQIHCNARPPQWKLIKMQTSQKTHGWTDGRTYHAFIQGIWYRDLWLHALRAITGRANDHQKAMRTTGQRDRETYI